MWAPHLTHGGRNIDAITGALELKHDGIALEVIAEAGSVLAPARVSGQADSFFPHSVQGPRRGFAFIQPRIGNK